MKVIARAGLKLPIKGVAFSNQEIGLEIERELPDDSTLDKTMSELVEGVVARYIALLEKELQDSQSDLLEKLQLKLAGEYEEKLTEARDIIAKLKGKN